MAQRDNPIEQIERLLRAGDAPSAAAAATALLAKVPNSFPARLGRARAYLMADRKIEAERDLGPALLLSPNDELANLLRAQLDLQYGKVDEGIARLQPLAEGRGPYATEAMLGMLDALSSSGQHDELRGRVRAGGAWTKDPRAPLHIARAMALEQPSQGIEELRRILRSAASPPDVRRRAGFEAAALLDQRAQYRDAYTTAQETHRCTGQKSETLREFLRPFEEQLQRLEQSQARREPWTTARAPHVEGIAMMIALPRSGTTLLEQMLDRHPQISGIGEYDGLRAIGHGLDATGFWPRSPSAISTAKYSELQSLYLEGVSRLRRPDATWAFDKVLRAWRTLPEIATILPGAVGIAVDRDPRDHATSVFLSYFRAGTLVWSDDFDAIRQVIMIKRKIVERALEVFAIPHVCVLYEDLIEDPAYHAARCLSLLGLSMDARVLHPEANTRHAVTLSSQQVKRPINRSSIGRWKNYAFAFDASWDSLVAEHEALLAASRTMRMNNATAR
jgi:hypothetical protein